MLLLAGCAAEGRRAGPPPAGDACEDQDGDGFGVGCSAGEDCDDSDRATHEGCAAPDLCHEGLATCACDAEGAEVDCGPVPQDYGDVTLCPQGRARCAGGAWGPCEPRGVPYGPPLPQGSGLPVWPVPCDPCNPGCKTFELDPHDACPKGGCTGVQPLPDGVTLLSPSAPSPPVLYDPAPGTCAHSLCEAGASGPLSPGCDAATPPPGCTAHTLGDRTLLVCGSGRSWYDARLTCLGQGLDLVTVSDADEDAALQGLAAAAFSGQPFWIGLRRLPNGESGWVTHHGFTHVNPEAPGDPAGACFVQTTNPPSTWTTRSCEEKRPFVCGGVPSAPGASCVTKVCDLLPQCCSAGWTTACLAVAKASCGFDCRALDDAATLCFRDGVDHDGDGWSFAEGDHSGDTSTDCDAGVNPGALEIAGNGVDDDCDGEVDEEPATCDQGLALASDDPRDFAKAVDLCKLTTADATGAARTWGVIDAAFVRADGLAVPASPKQHGLFPSFGTTTTIDPSTGLAASAPREGARMAAFSTGTARRPGDQGWVSPGAQTGGAWLDPSPEPLPAGYPQLSPACDVSPTEAFDGSGLRLVVRAPTNVRSFAYAVRLFSASVEQCTPFDDQAAVRLLGAHPSLVANQAAPHHGNATFDLDGSPLGASGAWLSSSSFLAGTGYDSPGCGATGWLRTHAPVLAGETFTLVATVWDGGAGGADSLLLVDGFRWSTAPSKIETHPDAPEPAPPFLEGTVEQKVDLSAVCGPNQRLSHTNLVWWAKTPGDSRIHFSVRAAGSAADLATAEALPLVFTAPPGPTALVGQPAVASAALGTEAAGVWLGKNLELAGVDPHAKHLALRARLVPSSDGSKAPALVAWSLGASCVD